MRYICGLRRIFNTLEVSPDRFFLPVGATSRDKLPGKVRLQVQSRSGIYCCVAIDGIAFKFAFKPGSV